MVGWGATRQIKDHRLPNPSHAGTFSMAFISILRYSFYKEFAGNATKIPSLCLFDRVRDYFAWVQHNFSSTGGLP